MPSSKNLHTGIGCSRTNLPAGRQPNTGSTAGECLLQEFFLLDFFTSEIPERGYRKALRFIENVSCFRRKCNAAQWATTLVPIQLFLIKFDRKGIKGG